MGCSSEVNGLVPILVNGIFRVDYRPIHVKEGSIEGVKFCGACELPSGLVSSHDEVGAGEANDLCRMTVRLTTSTWE